MAVRGSSAKAVLTTVLLPAPAPADNGTATLSTRGRRIVDADGGRFTLRPGNWRGNRSTWNGSGTGSADADHHTEIPLGLDHASMPESIAGFQESGINSVRRASRLPGNRLAGTALRRSGPIGGPAPCEGAPRRAEQSLEVPYVAVRPPKAPA